MDVRLSTFSLRNSSHQCHSHSRGFLQNVSLHQHGSFNVYPSLKFPWHSLRIGFILIAIEVINELLKIWIGWIILRRTLRVVFKIDRHN